MKGFQVTRTDKNDISVLYVAGFLDAHTVPQFESALNQLIEERRYKIVVNFKDLDYISSAGLGVFMGFIEEVRSNQGDIKLCNLSERVYKVFDLLGFPALFEIFDDEAQAIKSF
ncbi:STAS domain-containing protein [Caldithrix abyssi]|uniref:Anti-sigma factor antagonist n=1 Tax=Caldithrix abyssi DSM 13497 TaxID=880073 RepID=H1XTN0_CALAY|nr:STAS domain-containing protein [Caldithrix abyssi]APF17400.1 anti-sigma B factor antagonist [Caldithrix abyssi DSM 13497]EHO41505.1 anti-sigma-factor antagonist [Caldithrix abyssi DSM 13497]